MRFPILAALILCACSSVVPSTALRLSGLSPTTADPADFAVDLMLPEGIDIQPGTARLIFAVARTDTGQAQSGSFVLEREGTVFRIAVDDVDRLRDLQATARQWDAENDAATSGSLSISLSPCRIGDGPERDARVSVGLRLAQEGAFLPLIRNGPLSAVASEDEIREMPLCV